jgi:1-acyl-sn-glycerol-3-phosphate acyltransferase
MRTEREVAVLASPGVVTSTSSMPASMPANPNPARRSLLVARILLTIGGGVVAGVACFGPWPGFDLTGWVAIVGGATVLWAGFLPMEFALIAIGCVLIGGLWEACWRDWSVEAAPEIGASRSVIVVVGILVGMVASFAVLRTRLVAYRSNSHRSVVPVLAVLTVAIVLGFVFLPGSESRTLASQLAAAALFAPLGADILLFKNNVRGTPNLKHLLGGLWILIYLVAAQAVLFGVVLPIALLGSRRRFGVVRDLCASGMRLMFRWFPYGRFDREGLDREAFATPAVLVSNHQSSVDIPLILSLPTDVRLLVSRRVWRTPVLGIGARTLAHVLVEPGNPEVTLERCRSRFRSGASVHGFPEGTRSTGAHPNRFRRGVFEIAWELDADVLPVVLCNTRSCVSRDGFWVGDFWMSVKALPRVTPATFDYSLGSNALMKHVQRLVRDAVEVENRRIYSEPRFLTTQIEGLYRYQTRALRRRIRRDLEASATLPFCDALRSCRRILIVEEGPGTTSHRVSLPNLRATCVGWLLDWLPDDRMLAAASRSAAGNAMLTFVGWDPSALPAVPFDAVVLGRGFDRHTCDDSRAEKLNILSLLAPGGRVFLEQETCERLPFLERHGFEPIGDVPGGYEQAARLEVES